ncbi:MAG: M28 family peptidase, partial [Chloroflexi bacterium]
MKRLVLAALLVASCGPATVSASPTPRASLGASASAAVAGTGVFDGARAREHIAYLADPARGGRYSGSPGYLDAAAYVADQFKAIGLEPLGDGGTYFQRFPMPLVDLAATPSLTRTGADAKSWTHRVDFTESVGGRSGNGTAEAPVVVVGGAAKGSGQDDFAGVTTRGRIALVTGPTAGSVVETAFAEGAIGVLIIGDTSIRYSFIPHFFADTIPVLVGGHLDGVGTDPSGTVFSAANDNASGPAVTIEVARALAPRRAELQRSILFVAWAGEEEGLLGSEAYAGRMASSPGRVESLVAYLNLDVIGCCGNTLEASDENAALADRIRAAATRLGIPFQSIRGGGSDQTT